MSKYSKKNTSKKSSRQMTPRTAVETIKRYVKTEIAKNVENKCTATISKNGPVCTMMAGVPTTYKFYTFTPGQFALWAIAQGGAQDQRVGNSIKLKRWIIKGIIGIKDGTLPSSAAGYVDVYFGKYKKNIAAVDSSLNYLYQSGSTAITPSLLSTDTLCAINQDLYKVYYRKRFKIGVSVANPVGSPPAGPAYPQAASNNDMAISQTFGFDVCKYICKDRKITFSDNQLTPQDADLSFLTVWATYTPYNGQCTPINTDPADTLCYMTVLTYAEYEDA